MKKTISIVLVLTVLFGMVTVFAAGNEADPLITKNYAEGTFRKTLRSAINSSLNPTVETPLSRINAVQEHLGFEFASNFTRVRMIPQDTLTLKAGSSFNITSGTAILMYGRGTVVNISTGATIKSGTQLVRNQRYMCMENTTAYVVSSNAAVGFVDSYYKIENSQVTLFVERLYTTVFNRASDAAGLKHWVDHIIGGTMTPAQVASSFFFSTEFINRNVSNEDYVDRLYRALMNRAPDSSGRRHWINNLQSGMSRLEVFTLFVNSSEFANLCGEYGLTKESATPSIGVRMFVTRLYVEALNRQPDASGFNHWLNNMQNGMTGTTVAQHFIFSTEVINRKQTDDQYVEMLYRTLLGRASEAAGMQNWLNHLKNGMTREGVFNLFVSSPEFSNICRVHNVQR